MVRYIDLLDGLACAVAVTMIVDCDIVVNGGSCARLMTSTVYRILPAEFFCCVTDDVAGCMN